MQENLALIFTSYLPYLIIGKLYLIDKFRRIYN